MATTIYLLVAVTCLGTLIYIGTVLTRNYLRWHGERLVTCPETKTPTGVEVNAKHAVVTAAFGKQELILQDCTHWPEKRDCGQECLDQIEASPETCLVRNILTDWYQGRTCIYCQRPFAEIHWHDHKPVFQSPDGDFLEWQQLNPEKLPEILQAHLAVCWDCFIAENFRQKHPDLVVDDPRKQDTLP